MRRRDAGERSNGLSTEIERNLAPREPALRGVGQRYGRVEMSTRDRTKSKDESHERRASRDGVGQEPVECRSFRTRKWLRHSLRIEPMTRSAKGFCQGAREAMSTSRIPIRSTRHANSGP
jgi:hypothetical protein